ncbi:hypothetical protein NQZ79_g5135 [Umbelopsis isabellina]|nr:hypothetical protein NQZ79_g5135 [Umbelopsis isabellina]
MKERAGESRPGALKFAQFGFAFVLAGLQAQLFPDLNNVCYLCVIGKLKAVLRRYSAANTMSNAPQRLHLKQLGCCVPGPPLCRHSGESFFGFRVKRAKHL